LKQIWNRYKSTVFRNCTVADESTYELAYWRNHLFALAVLYVVPLSFIAIIPGMYMAYIVGLNFLLVADIIVLAILALIVFSSRISIQGRKLLFFFGLYLVSTALLYELGSFGPGLLFLLAITFLITLIYEQKTALLSVLINTGICIVFGFLIHYEATASVMIQEYGVDSWFALSANLIFLCLITVLLVPGLFQGLESSFKKRNQLQVELEKKQIDLELSMRQLEEKNLELEEFAYTASHDLKEPLRTVRNFVELLKRKYEGRLDDKADEYISIASDGAGRMAVLIDDLLEYSRVGRMHTKVEQVDLNKLVSEITESLKSDPEAGSVEIEAENLSVVPGVPVSLKMLFQNLIFNGIKYQPKGNKPRVRITCSKSNGMWHFSVSDNGIGIEEEQLEDIFKLFKRLHAQGEYSGSGMGLAICKKVVNQHGGEIWAESEPNKGSTFHFTLSASGNQPDNELKLVNLGQGRSV
jgi:signal transduction histidine kinase